MSDLKLVIFDVDGTLVDSQGSILAAMGDAFAAVDAPLPPRSDVLNIVGLSLPLAMAQLAPEQSAASQAHMVEAYKSGFARRRLAGESAPLYPGIAELLERLSAVDELLLAVATGKSRRGLDALIDGHALQKTFVSTQVADDHPSKPNPSMIYAALSQAGVEPDQAVMIGDTTYDMDMAQAAGVPAIGVAWGYHPVSALHKARVVVETAQALEHAIFEILGEPV